MRLNFSAVDEGDIREGVRRIGKVVAEQVALYGTLTGEAAPQRAPVEAEGEGAEIVHMPTRRREGKARRK
jgi:2-aminoadipate transaminase